MAGSLTRLGTRLARTGQLQAALAPTQEAVTIRRQLADTDPDAYLPGLAMALNNLGAQLADTGQRHAALLPPPRKPSPSAASSPRPTPTPTSPTWPWR